MWKLINCERQGHCEPQAISLKCCKWQQKSNGNQLLTHVFYCDYKSINVIALKYKNIHNNECNKSKTKRKSLQRMYSCEQKQIKKLQNFI